MTQSETNTTQGGSRQGLVRALWLVKEEHSYASMCKRLIHAAQHTRLVELLHSDPFFILVKEHQVYDMQGELNQTQLYMNECGYMGFPKRVYYVWNLQEVK